MIIRDENMIEMVKSGNEEAFELLFKKYCPIVLNQRNRYHLRDHDLDDWLQEGRLVCFQSIEKYDASKSVTFGLFFKINFERHVISLLRYQQAKKRQIYYCMDSLDEVKIGQYKIDKEDCKAQTNLEYIFVREALEDLPTSFSKFEIQVYYYVLKGESLEEISKRLNTSISKVKYGYNRIKKKIKREIL